MTTEGELVDRIGVRLHPTRDDMAILPVSPAVLHEGETLVSAMMLAADIASGIRLHEPGIATVLTTSFSLRRSRRPGTGPVAAVPTRLFAEGSRVVDRLDFRAESGDAIASGRISFVVRRSDAGSQAPIRPDTRHRYRTPWSQPITEPLAEVAGIEISDPATGRVTLRATDAVRRGGGIVQGAFVTLMGETSALALAGHTYRANAIVEALDVDFLAAVSADAVSTEARWLDMEGDSDIEVVLRDDSTSSTLAVFVIGVTQVSIPAMARDA